MKRALIVFAKKPEAGKVKTRLVPPLTFEEAKELYICFLKDALIQYSMICMRQDLKIFLTVTPDDASGHFEEFVRNIPEIDLSGNDIVIMTQSGFDLGERMMNAFTEVFSSGCTHAVVIGTDHPTLPDRYVEDAFSELDQHKTDCVIGPSEDGGFYLLGLKDCRNAYFDNVPWSTGMVFDNTIKNLRNADRTVHVLPEWYDVDDTLSLDKLMYDLVRNDGESAPFYSMRFLSQMKRIEV